MNTTGITGIYRSHTENGSGLILTIEDNKGNKLNVRMARSVKDYEKVKSQLTTLKPGQQITTTVSKHNNNWPADSYFNGFNETDHNTIEDFNVFDF